VVLLESTGMHDAAHRRLRALTGLVAFVILVRPPAAGARDDSGSGIFGGEGGDGLTGLVATASTP